MTAALPAVAVDSELAALWASTLNSVNATFASWECATAFLEPRTIQESGTGELQPSPEQIEAIRVLHEHGETVDLLDWHTQRVEGRFKDIIQGEIDEHFAQSDGEEAGDPDPARLAALLVRLATYLELWSQPHQALAPSVPSSSTSSASSPPIRFRKHFLCLLFPLLTRQEFVTQLRRFLEHTLDLSCSPPDYTEAQHEHATRGIQAIHFLSLFERFEPVALGIVYSQIEERIQSEAAGDLESSDVLSGLGQWLANTADEWLVSLYALAFSELAEDAARTRAAKLLRPTLQRFEYHVYSELFKLRVSELFEIVVDFPASLPAIKDLQACLAKVDQKTYLVRSLCRQVKKRLLHPGADTKDILTSYINLIKVLKALDNSNVILARAAGEVRAYLKNRSDTIRCIVQGMVDENGDLLNELRGPADGDDNTASAQQQELKEEEEDALEDYTDEGYKWTPAPVDAPLSYLSVKRADIVQLLVSIYDTKELFVKELQLLLANRLLQVRNYDFDRELRNIEILKIRFGEQALAGLEVMFKDMADSKRVDHAIHTSSLIHPSQANALHPAILSHLFWPTFPRPTGGSMRLPGQLKKLTDGYEKVFRKLKPEKKLVWIPNMGSVTVEIQLRDRHMELQVSPTQAAVLELFGEQSERTLKGLTSALKLSDPAPIKAAMQFWTGKGVIAPLPASASVPEESVRWIVCETSSQSVELGGSKSTSMAVTGNQPSARSSGASKGGETIPDLTASVTLTGGALESLKSYFPFITNILTNLHSMPTQRLHSMLVAVAPGFKASNHSVQEMHAFLELARKEGVLGKSPAGEWILATA